MPNTLARIDSTGLWLPRVTYHRASDERRIELIGMIHIADRHFYHDVQTRLDKADTDGDTICYEGIKALTDTERAHLNPTQLHATTTLRAFLNNAYNTAEQLGLAKQKDLITLADHWTRTDLGELDFLRTLGARNLTKFHLINKFLELAPSEAITAGLTRDTFIDSFEGQRFLRALLTGALIDRNAVLHTRDAIGAQGILSATAHGHDVVSPWGNSHLPGIGRILTTSGFEPAGTSDHLAISRDKLTAIDEISNIDDNDHPPG